LLYFGAVNVYKNGIETPTGEAVLDFELVNDTTV